MNTPGVTLAPDGRSVTVDLSLNFAPAIRAMNRLQVGAELAQDNVNQMFRTMAGEPRLCPEAVQAGREARYYIRGALHPRYSDPDAADRFVQVLARANVGAAVAFIRGQAERREGRPMVRHNHHRWGDTAVQVVTR